MGTPVSVVGTLQKCAFGIAPSPMGVLPTARVMSSKKPVATMMDNAPFLNIAPFAMCTSPSNPAVAAAGFVPQPCAPMMPAPWMMTSMRCMAGKKPLVTQGSCVMCMWAGMIKPIAPGQFQTMAPAP